MRTSLDAMEQRGKETNMLLKKLVGDLDRFTRK
jgi:hypothetical protein